MLNFLKPLYRLAEIGTIGVVHFKTSWKNKLRMQYVIAYSSFYYQKCGKQLNDLCATYVSHTLHGGNKLYSESCRQYEDGFRCSDRALDNTKFAGPKNKKG